MNVIPTAVGNPIGADGRAQNPNAPPTNNGISGDARRASAELGKKFIDMKVDYAVRQITQLLAAKSASAAR
jgi:creatinine amidohydrolase/Fe(II)-dependent formamide hydrolase-like protein